MRILFMGTSSFAIPCLYKLAKSKNKLIAVVTQPDRPKDRGLEVKSPPVKEIATALGITVIQPAKAKKETFIKSVEELNLDLIVVVSFGQILPKYLLKIPKHGCINIHPSLLPKYRGPAPIQWAIINGEAETGISTVYVDERIDAGDIISQKKIPVEPSDNAITLADRMSPVSADMLLEAIDSIKLNSVQRVPQEDKRATYAPSLSREDGLVNWALPSVKIHNLIRGLIHWPGTYTYLNGEHLKICETELYSEQLAKTYKKETGKILCRIKNQGWLVKTGDGKILVKKIQPAAKRIMTVDEYCCGHAVEIGTFFKNK